MMLEIQKLDTMKPELIVKAIQLYQKLQKLSLGQSLNNNGKMAFIVMLVKKESQVGTQVLNVQIFLRHVENILAL